MSACKGVILQQWKHTYHLDYETTDIGWPYQDTSEHSLLGTEPNYHLDCEETDSEGYKDVDENEIPELVKHTEATLDEIDRLEEEELKDLEEELTCY